jgi:hypothetical protein
MLIQPSTVVKPVILAKKTENEKIVVPGVQAKGSQNSISINKS